jgi:hypothetical protein
VFGPDGKIAAADHLSRFSWIPPNRVWVYFRRRFRGGVMPRATTNHSPSRRRQSGLVISSSIRLTSRPWRTTCTPSSEITKQNQRFRCILWRLTPGLDSAAGRGPIFLALRIAIEARWRHCRPAGTFPIRRRKRLPAPAVRAAVGFCANRGATARRAADAHLIVSTGQGKGQLVRAAFLLGTRNRNFKHFKGALGP